jgi:hypothetical protein
MTPIVAESIAPMTRRVPHVLLFMDFAQRNPSLRERLAVLDRCARWHGRAFVVLTASVSS